MPAHHHAKIFQGTPRNLARLARALRDGQIVGVPTETVYGLAADAFNRTACRKIFHAKRRPASDPLIVHLHRASDLSRVAKSNPAADALAKAFWPGPLTIVLPKQPAVPDIVTAGLESVAVRVPDHPLLRRLIALTGQPLAAPSANPFGYISPTCAEHVRAGLGARIDFILDGGPSRIGLESTIVDLRTPGRPLILRPGAITAAQIASVLGKPIRQRARANQARTASHSPQIAPGMLKRHYSPRTPVVLHDRLEAATVKSQASSADDAWVFLAKPALGATRNVFWLDPHGRLAGVARRLFSVLRTLDAKGFRAIHVERATGGGLADAINDRLSRAAARD